MPTGYPWPPCPVCAYPHQSCTDPTRRTTSGAHVDHSGVGAPIVTRARRHRRKVRHAPRARRWLAA